jgi:hypothetical protein
MRWGCSAETAKRDRSVSPTADGPEMKRARAEEEETIAVDTPEEPIPAAVVDDFDSSALPAEIVGGGKIAQFKEEPFTYLSADDEQVKLCMYVLLPSPRCSH